MTNLEHSTKSKARSSVALAAALLGSVALGPLLFAAPAKAATPMNCSALAAFVTSQAKKNLNKAPVAPSGTTISSATPVTAVIKPASGSNLAYCQVVFQLDPAITIEVGLPLNTAD